MNQFNFKNVMFTSLQFLWRSFVLGFMYGITVKLFPWIAINVVIAEITITVVAFAWMLYNDVISYNSKRSRTIFERVTKQEQI